LGDNCIIIGVGNFGRFIRFIEVLECQSAASAAHADHEGILRIGRLEYETGLDTPIQNFQGLLPGHPASEAVLFVEKGAISQH
jgi:hypothetical protein